MKNTRTYVIADIHGRFDLLELAWHRIQADADKHGVIGTVVTLGDYVDRGPQSKEVMEFLMGGLPQPWTLICLKGNHEDMMAGAYNPMFGHEIQDWLRNGGDATLASFGISDAAELDPAIMAWAAGLPILHFDERRVFVHAGVDETLELDQQLERFVLWTRKPMNNGYRGRFIVHGHTPHEHPRQTQGSLNLDTGAFATGRLVVGVFDDTQPEPIVFIECRL